MDNRRAVSWTLTSVCGCVWREGRGGGGGFGGRGELRGGCSTVMAVPSHPLCVARIMIERFGYTYIYTVESVSKDTVTL